MSRIKTRKRLNVVTSLSSIKLLLRVFYVIFIFNKRRTIIHFGSINLNMHIHMNNNKIQFAITIDLFINFKIN